MKVVSVLNYKGGVGKTTVTSNLAAYVASKGKRVLMIDVDPQTNLTFSFIDNIAWEKQYAENKTLKNFFSPILNMGEKKISFADLIIPLKVPDINLDIISSHLDLLDVDIKLAAHLVGANLQMLANKYLMVHNYLREEIEKLKEKYDLILIDCAPNFSIVTKNALVASDNYLTPSKMDYLSTFGVQQLTRNVEDFLKEYNLYMQTVKDATIVDPKLLGIVATMVQIYGGDLIAKQKGYWDTLKSRYKIFNTFIRENPSHFAEAPSNGIPVILSKNTPANIKEELQKFGDEFIQEAMI